MFLLYLTHRDGYVQVVTFSSVEVRGYAMIAMAHLPVVMRTADY